MFLEAPVLYTLVKQSTTAQAVIAVINTQGERCDVLHNLASGARFCAVCEGRGWTARIGVHTAFVNCTNAAINSIH